MDVPVPHTLRKHRSEGGVAFIARTEGHGGQHSGAEPLTPPGLRTWALPMQRCRPAGG